MDRLQTAITALHEADAESGRRKSRSRLTPVARLIVCIGFLGVTVSFDKYNIAGLLSMSLYLIVTGIWEEISLWKGFSRLKYIFAVLLLLGIANIFYDRNVIIFLGGIPITGGMLSFVTLFLKGAFAVYGAYFLLLTVGIDRLCMALRKLKVPRMMVTVLLLTYRYLIVLLKEAQRMMQAYELRSFRHRGIHIRAWGDFPGLLLLRSMDRALQIYDSMLLRGYDGEFLYEMTERKAGWTISVLYMAGWLALFALLRSVPVFALVGKLFL